MRFSRQEYWHGLPFPPPGDLSNPGIEPESLMSPALTGRFFTTSATWEAQHPDPQFSFYQSGLSMGMDPSLQNGWHGAKPHQVDTMITFILPVSKLRLKKSPTY